MLCPSCQARNSDSARWCWRCFGALAEEQRHAAVPPGPVPWPGPVAPLSLPPRWASPPPLRRRRARPAALAVLVFVLAQAVTVATVLRLNHHPAHHAVVVPAGDPREAVELTLSSVVQVGGIGCGGGQAGTGFVVAPGMVATNAHVVAGLVNPEVSPFSAQRQPATLVAFDPVSDLALLSVSYVSDNPLVLSRQGATDGEKVAAAGFGGGHSLRTRDGVVRFRGDVTTTDIFHKGTGNRAVIEVTMASESGDSGSPIVDGAGEVVGILFGGSISKPGQTYATDVVALERLIEQPAIGEGTLQCAAGASEIVSH